MSYDMHYRHIRSRGPSPSPREDSTLARRPLARRLHRNSIKRQRVDDVAIYDDDLYDDYPAGATPAKPKPAVVGSPSQVLTVRRPSELEKFNVFNVGGGDGYGREISGSGSERYRERSRSRSRSRVRFEGRRERQGPMVVRRYHVPRIPDSRIFDVDDDEDDDPFWDDGDADDWDGEEDDDDDDETDSAFFSSEANSSGTHGHSPGNAEIVVNVKASVRGSRSRRRSTQSEPLPMVHWPREAFRRGGNWDSRAVEWKEEEEVETERVGVREVSGRRVRRMGMGGDKGLSFADFRACCILLGGL
ncbi:uncharacterized protein EI97DRAFT_150517 [Westerdykella ornata]|uniref:Uncharacterized protein n=1 Tax=Westerdykella ornata TaxID=318751 RepID=A0A6A6JDI6_WESOR|nr:uncharacterized protein EI97DRAFT_150517 [Westerdykella ornata]KAF2273696.1 hypothetical protein EI97DRAFT_150517 [Westerdykella ornata]